MSEALTPHADDRSQKFVAAARGIIVPSMPKDQIDPEIFTKLNKARIMLCTRFAGMAALVAPMRITIVADEHCPTAMTNCYKDIWLGHDFVLGLDSHRELGTILAHEALHAALMHGTRRGQRHPMVTNLAQDLQINNILHNEGLHFNGFKSVDRHQVRDMLAGSRPPEEAICLDTLNKADMLVDTWEDIYRYIMPEQPKSEMGGGATGGDVQPDLKHDGEGEGDGEGDGDGAPSEEQINAEMKKRLAAAAAADKAAGKKQGDHTSSFFGRQVDDMLQSKLPIDVLLRRAVRKHTARNDWSKRRINRRALQRGMIKPGLYSEQIGTFAVCCDTSGSVDDQELALDLAHVRRVIRECNPKETLVSFVDTQVRNVQRFTRGQAVKFDPAGGGGTDFRPGVKWAESVRPDLLVYFTDGWGSFPDAEPGFPVIWVLVGRGAINESDVPWGHVVRCQQ